MGGEEGKIDKIMLPKNLFDNKITLINYGARFDMRGHSVSQPTSQSDRRAKARLLMDGGAEKRDILTDSRTEDKNRPRYRSQDDDKRNVNDDALNLEHFKVSFCEDGGGTGLDGDEVSTEHFVSSPSPVSPLLYIFLFSHFLIISLVTLVHLRPEN